MSILFSFVLLYVVSTFAVLQWRKFVLSVFVSSFYIDFLLHSCNSYFHKVLGIFWLEISIVLQFLRVSVDRFSRNGPFSQYIKHTDSSEHKKSLYVSYTCGSFNVKMLTFPHTNIKQKRIFIYFLFSRPLWYVQLYLCI